MTNIRYFNWSALDRSTIKSILKKIGREVINIPLTPLAFTKKIRKQIRNAGIPVKVTTSFRDETDENSIWVAGLYESYKDKKNTKFITLTLQYNPNDNKIYCSYLKFDKLCTNIADTLLHEVIHARQYRRRNYKTIVGYESFADSGKQRIDQEYFGHDDEIDAYGFNIACSLTDQFAYNHKEIMKYLNQDLSDDRLKRNSYRDYLNAFDHNHNHPVIKKLKKKIIHYLPYAEIGKPYKTSDWLKK
jgi:hypothetical protein